MAKKRLATKTKTDDLSLTRITRTVYFFIGFYILSLVVFDSGNLITSDAIVDRASLVFALVVVNTLTWYAAAERGAHAKTIFTYILTLTLLVFAGFATYWERGMASTSTIFYVLPLLSIATLKNRHALLAVAALASATYGFAAFKYFKDFFNEGLRIQLWGQMILYIGAIFTISWLIMIVAGLRHDSK